jgi:hypothetical protein
MRPSVVTINPLLNEPENRGQHLAPRLRVGELGERGLKVPELRERAAAKAGHVAATR